MMERKERGWTTKAFFPDVTDILNHKETAEAAMSRHYTQARPLAEGTLALLNAGAEDGCDCCKSAHELLAAFLDAMEMGEKVFDEADVHNRPPFVSLDELGKMLGDRGQAEVAICVNREGYAEPRRVRIGQDYSVKNQGKAA